MFLWICKIINLKGLKIKNIHVTSPLSFGEGLGVR